jgi:hypothetical protein
VAGGKVYIGNPVEQGALIAGGDIELGPNARIQGSMRYRSPKELKRAAGAQVAGLVERLPLAIEAISQLRDNSPFGRHHDRTLV